MHFQKYFLRKYIFKIAPIKNTFLKLLPQKNIPSKMLSQEIYFQSCSIKKYIFEITFSKNTNLIALIYSSSESSKELSLNHQYV